jgi:gas vesicle protein
VGIAVGLGVLFAPNSGEATRRQVRDRLTALLDDLRPQLDKAKNVVQETMAAASEGSTEKDEHATTDFPSKKDQAN